MRARNKKQRQLLNELETNPLIERACKKVAVARSTFYRWCESDSDFKERAEAAIVLGRDKMNDFVESRLLESIGSGSMQGIRYWLDHNSKRYAGVSAAEIKRLRFFEGMVIDLLDTAANEDDYAVLRIITQIREQAKQQKRKRKTRNNGDERV